MHCALFAHKGGSFGIRELRQSDSDTTVREMKLGGTVVISLILCFVSRNKAQVTLIFFSFFHVYFLLNLSNNQFRAKIRIRIKVRLSQNRFMKSSIFQKMTEQI